jgi:aspartate kinase
MIRNKEERGRLASRMEEVFGEGQRLCEGTMLLHELTPRTLDSISSLGERLSAPLVAGALRELGVRSEAIEAAELITTDSYHSAAEPFMDLTREHSQARLRPLLDQGIVPVVTGFIGALRMEFAQDVAHEKVEHITVDPTIAIVAIVGENM